jgi:DNA-binding protein HU-beta
MKTLQKNDVIEECSSIAKLAEKDTQKVIEAFLEVLERNLKVGNKINLTGYFNFSVRGRKEFTSRNPSTGKPVLVPACNITVVKLGTKIKKIKS